MKLIAIAIFSAGLAIVSFGQPNSERLRSRSTICPLSRRGAISKTASRSRKSCSHTLRRQRSRRSGLLMRTNFMPETNATKSRSIYCVCGSRPVWNSAITHSRTDSLNRIELGRLRGRSAERRDDHEGIVEGQRARDALFSASFFADRSDDGDEGRI